MLPGSQGDYDLAISVDPNNSSLIYLGGDRVGSGRLHLAMSSVTEWVGIFNDRGIDRRKCSCRCARRDACAGRLQHSVGRYRRRDIRQYRSCRHRHFVARNTGLATLCTNFFSQHPLEPAVLFGRTPDNGTTRYTGEEAWRHVLFADGGYCVVNWNNSFKILLSANANVFRATDGGQDSY